MSDNAAVVKAYVWQNGMVMAFDKNGNQVPDYQGRKEDVLDKLKRDFPAADIEGAIWARH